MTDITTLIARLEAATGPDRSLAREIQCAVGGWHRVTPSQCNRKRGGYISPLDWIGRRHDGVPILDGTHGTDIHDDVPDITYSIDAAVALAERVLPGWRGSVQFGNFECQVTAYLCSDEDTKDVMAVHRSPAIALTIAILKAKQAEGTV